MLKLHENQVNLWDAIIPKHFRDLPKELAQVDALLNDPSFMQPFIDQFSTKSGRPTMAVDTYLRLIYLKRRSNLSYETLIREVGDRISWRRFCRIAIDQKMPSSSTLIKAHQRYGEEMFAELDLMIGKARRK